MKKILTITAVIILCVLSGPAQAFDHHHGLWDILLKKHVTPAGGPGGFRVNYEGMKNDRALMGTFMDQMTSVSRETFDAWSLNRRRAFLINAYNVFVIRLVLDHYPVESIKDIGGWFTDPFDIEFIPLLDGTLSLNGVEHRLMALDGDAPDPRLRLLLFRASRGCPHLATDAVTHENIGDLLESSLVGFLADREKNRFNPQKKRVELSALFQWYASDFSARYGSLDAFVRIYADAIASFPGDSLDLLHDPVGISFLSYDWSLNGR
ncbi:hypothetical protein JCM14469_30870 [Desulfatiferula olefinivorans]